MAQVINTNIASLNAQRNLNRSQSALGTSLQRLSSGMRINSAKDDAAGLAISERFTAQIRGLNQAVRNSNDGISLAQTAEGALGEVTNNLQRVRELAVQSANATNSTSDRQAMQQEVAQLVEEIDRVAGQTNFNGVKLLDGSFTSQEFQVGANVGETISLSSIIDATKGGLGLDDSTASVTGTAVTAALAAGDLTINGNDVGVVATGSAKAIGAAIEAADSDVNATATTAVAAGAFTAHAGATDGDSFAISVAGVSMSYTAAGGTGITAANVQSAVTGAAASLTTAGITVTGTVAGGDLTFTDADGDNVAVTKTVGGATTANFASLTAGTKTGTVSLSSTAQDIVIAGTTPSKAGLTAGTTAATGNTLDVSTVSGANALITAVDAALNTVNGSRATLGAMQNRFESVVTSLQTSSESLSAAKSRIADADFAAETANLTKTQILQQAGTAMLAQANQLPQGVLSLLR